MFGGVRDIIRYDGKLYIGSLQRGVFIFDPGSEKFYEFGKNVELPSKQIVSLASLEGTLYMGTKDGLAVYDGSRIDVLREIENVTMKATVLGVDVPGKNVYAASIYLAGGLVKKNGSGWKFIGGEGRGLFNDVSSFAFLEGIAYFGSNAGALYRYDGTTIESATEKFFPAHISALGVLGGKVFVGTNRGLYKVDDKSWEKVSLPGPFDSAPILHMFEGEGELLLGTTEGLVKYAEGKVDTLSVNEGLPSNRVYSVMRLDGAVYAGIQKGLVKINGW